MTLSDLEWPFRASRAISAVAELLFHILNATHTRLTIPCQDYAINFVIRATRVFGQRDAVGTIDLIRGMRRFGSNMRYGDVNGSMSANITKYADWQLLLRCDKHTQVKLRTAIDTEHSTEPICMKHKTYV